MGCDHLGSQEIIGKQVLSGTHAGELKYWVLFLVVGVTMSYLAQVELTDHARVEAELPPVLVHSGGSSGHSPPRHFNKREGQLLVQQGALGQVNTLLAALERETFHLAGVVGEGGSVMGKGTLGNCSVSRRQTR